MHVNRLVHSPVCVFYMYIRNYLKSESINSITLAMYTDLQIRNTNLYIAQLSILYKTSSTERLPLLDH